MAGFFKKLFNRITGRPSEETAAPAPEQAALPAPEPAASPALEPETESVLAAQVVEQPLAKTPVPTKPEPKKAELSKPQLKKTETKKAEPKKSEALKPAQKKVEPKKAEPKRSEAKKAEAPKPALKKPEVASPKKAEPQKAGAKKLEAKQAEPKKPEPRTPELKAKTKATAAAPPTVVEEPPQSTPEVPVAERPQPEPITPAIVAEAPAPRVPPTPAPAPPVPASVEPQRGGWFSRLRDGLSKSSKSISGSITSIFTKKKLDKETLQDLEDTLIQADLGLPVAERIIKQVSAGRYDKEVDPDEVKQILASEVAKVLKPVEVPFNFGSEKPFVIMVVGVNGSGKTTTIGKLGSIAAGEGFKVMFAAGDTFRAAAIEQLSVWGKRIGAETISRPTGADAAGLAFDALKQAQESGTDILFIDTAGRLQNKAHLMNELDKVVRVIKKLDAQAPHAVLLVLDATTGQNALSQAEVFTKVAGVTGLIMTKLDGTARGGILVAIAEKFKLPIHAIGVGESIDDLQPFDADGFARAIAGLDEK